MSDYEELQVAVGHLANALNIDPPEGDGGVIGETVKFLRQAAEAVGSLRTELAERDEQEPVGEVEYIDCHPDDEGSHGFFTAGEIYDKYQNLPHGTKLYRHPPAPAAVLDWHAITQAVEEMVDHYEYRGGEGDYTPTETERVLIQDAAMEVLDTIAPMLQFSKPASRSESEIKAEALDNQGKALEALARRHEDEGDDEHAQGLWHAARMVYREAARLRGEGSE